MLCTVVLLSSVILLTYLSPSYCTPSSDPQSRKASPSREVSRIRIPRLRFPLMAQRRSSAPNSTAHGSQDRPRSSNENAPAPHPSPHRRPQLHGPIAHCHSTRSQGGHQGPQMKLTNTIDVSLYVCIDAPAQARKPEPENHDDDRLNVSRSSASTQIRHRELYSTSIATTAGCGTTTKYDAQLQTPQNDADKIQHAPHRSIARGQKSDLMRSWPIQCRSPGSQRRILANESGRGRDRRQHVHAFKPPEPSSLSEYTPSSEFRAPTQLRRLGPTPITYDSMHRDRVATSIRGRAGDLEVREHTRPNPTISLCSNFSVVSWVRTYVQVPRSLHVHNMHLRRRWLSI
ncbi:hypothetical protein C8Q78DRAFT_233211 [Trametes maxima]|nr:hypothetical protein C8Q78DRAFT_233211 [Trametes maxima]